MRHARLKEKEGLMSSRVYVQDVSKWRPAVDCKLANEDNFDTTLTRGR